MNFWTELSPIGRRHSPRFRTKVLRNIRRMFSVNFAQDEICFRLTLFVWLTRMHLSPTAHAHILPSSKRRGRKTTTSITSKKRVGILIMVKTAWGTEQIVPVTQLWNRGLCNTCKLCTRSRSLLPEKPFRRHSQKRSKWPFDLNRLKKRWISAMVIPKKRIATLWKRSIIIKISSIKRAAARKWLSWCDGSPAHGLPRNGNKYFDGYQICATGLRNFVAAVRIPLFSLDACFSKHTYYKGVYGNLVALVDTKAGKLTNVLFALTTDESEQESLYIGLFNASECNNADSELAKRMKESVSCVIGDGSAQFLNAAQTTFGDQKPIATCSLHVKENVRKSCK